MAFPWDDAPLDAEPLDVSGLGGSLPPGQGAPAPKKAESKWKQLGPLLALLPLAAKGGGREAIAALMQGYQQARAQRTQQGQQQQRYDQQDARATEQTRYQRQRDQRTDRRQSETDTATATDRTRTQQRMFLEQFEQAVHAADDPETVKALIALYGGQAEALGLPRPALEAFAMQAATPDRLLARKVQKRWSSMSVEERKQAQQGMSLSIDGMHIPHDKWSPIVGGLVDPKTGAYPQAAQSGGWPLDVPLDRLLAAAIAAGDTQRADVIRQAIREMDEQRRDPRQPPSAVAQETAQLRLQSLMLQTEMARVRLDAAQRAATTAGTGQRLSPGQQSELSDIKLLSDQIAQTLDMGITQKWEGVGGLYQGSVSELLMREFGRGSEEGAKLRATIGNIRGYITKLRAGTAMTPGEQKLLDSYTPTINESPAGIVAKLEQLQDFLLKKAESLVSVTQQSPADIVDAMRAAPTGTPVQTVRPTRPRVNPFAPERGR